MPLSCTIFEIFDVEEYRDLEIYVRGHSPCELMHDLCTTEIYRPDALFLLLIVQVNRHSALRSEFCKKLHRARWCVTVVQGYSRSSILVPIDSPYAISY